MKPGQESTGVQRAPEKEEFVSRKLIRPSLPHVEARANGGANGGAASGERPPRTEKAPRPERKAYVPDQTFAENFYFQKQVQAKTVMTIVLKNGEMVLGTIEWYDKNCVKVSRAGKPNLLLYKPSIRYMYKSAEESRR